MKKQTLSFLAVAMIYGSYGPVQSQVFQNNNTSCEDVPVVGNVLDDLPPMAQNNPFVSHSISCGNFNDDSAFGNPGFPDCITQRDPIPFQTLGGIPENFPPTNSLFFNTGAHGNNCLNAGEPNAQFQPSTDMVNQTMDPLAAPGVIRYGTIRVGNLDNQAFDDFALVNPVNTTNSSGINSVQFLLSQPDGSFGDPDFTPSIALPTSSDQVHFPLSLLDFPVFTPSNNLGSERTLALSDCDNDGFNDGIYLVRSVGNGEGEFADTLELLVSKNNGTGLQKAEITFSVVRSITPAAETNSALTMGDFNQDGINDVMVAFNDDPVVPIPGDQVAFCEGLGSCKYDCTTIPQPFDNHIYLNLECQGDPNCDVFPTSITSGDYNGDGLTDIAVAMLGLRKITYYFNNTNAISTWLSQAVTFTAPEGFYAAPLIVESGRFSPEAYRSNTDEVVASVVRLSLDVYLAEAASTIEFMSSDGQGAINAPTPLVFNPALGPSTLATGLTVKDFDHCGGDDVIGLAQTFDTPDSITRHASLFLNVNEPPVITISGDGQGLTEDNIDIQASCEDPTGDDRTFTWRVVNGPEGAETRLTPATGSLFSPATDASTVFFGDRVGVYTIELNCTDFCGAQDVKTVQVTLDQVLRTQGGCLASLNPADLAPSFSGWAWLWMLVPGLGLKAFRKIKKS